MPRLLRLACFAALASSVCIPQAATACLPPEPPPPPPRNSAESDSDFAARSRKWYSDLFEAEERASLPGRVAKEDRLWATAQRVALARIEKIGSIRLRGSEGQYYKSPLVTLRTIQWLKGNPSPRRLKVHFLSDDSCAFGGAGDAADGGEVGDIILLFYKPGPIEPRNILYTFGRDRVVTARSRAAFDRAESSGLRPELVGPATCQLRELVGASYVPAACMAPITLPALAAKLNHFGASARHVPGTVDSVASQPSAGPA